MDDKQSFLDAFIRQMTAMNRAPIPSQFVPKSNCCVEDVKYQGYFDDSTAGATATLRETLEEFQGPDLRIDELSTIRKILEQCTIDASRREVIHVLEAACSHPEECIDCTYKNSLGECNRNERIADTLLNRFGRVK